MKLPDLSGGPRDEREVVGIFKMAGVTDPDQIYAMKLELLRPASERIKLAKWGFFALLAMTVGLFVTVIGIIVIPAVVGLMVPLPFKYMNGKRLAGIVERGTREYCESIGVRPV